MEITSNDLCTGCGTCANICPTSSIKMIPNDEGFLYPTIDSTTCIHCELCKRVCPSNLSNDKPLKNTLNYFAVQTQDPYLRSISTSGGFFSIIAKYVLTNNGEVYAAGYNGKTEVVHKKITEIKDIPTLCGSKYVQSNLDDTYKKIEKSLRKDIQVLFVATPCQIAGLYSYLNEKKCTTQNLITIELKCYGIPSPGLFKQYISFLNKKYKCPVASVNFRDKKYGYSANVVSITLQNNRTIANKFWIKSYSKTFFSGLNIRLSCYNCKFRNLQNSMADFIVGDFKDIDQYIPNMDDDKGTTLVCTTNKRSEGILQSLDFLNYVPIKNYKDQPPRTPEKNIKREQFFCASKRNNWQNLIKLFAPFSIQDALSNILKPILAKLPISTKVFKLIGKRNKNKYLKRTKEVR